MVLPKKALKNNSKSPFFPDAALPVTQVMAQLAAALNHPGRAVLQAPPGSGKTIRVPLALLDEPWLAGKKFSCGNPAAWRPGPLLPHLVRHPPPPGQTPVIKVSSLSLVMFPVLRR
jgi:hypothetical protein